MNYGRRIAAALLIAALLWGVCGCMSGKSNPGREDLVRLLEERYEDSFAYYGPGGGRNQIYCTSEQYQKHLIWVKYDSETDSYTENYLCVKYEEQAENLLSQILSEVFPEGSYAWLKGTMCDGVSPEGASNETTFEEYIASSKPALSACVIVQEGKCGMSRDEAEQRLRDAVEASGMTLVSLDLFFTSSDQYAGVISDTQFSDFMSAKDYEERIRMKFRDEASGG